MPRPTESVNFRPMSVLTHHTNEQQIFNVGGSLYSDNFIIKELLSNQPEFNKLTLGKELLTGSDFAELLRALSKNVSLKHVCIKADFLDPLNEEKARVLVELVGRLPELQTLMIHFPRPGGHASFAHVCSFLDSDSEVCSASSASDSEVYSASLSEVYSASLSDSDSYNGSLEDEDTFCNESLISNFENSCSRPKMSAKKNYCNSLMLLNSAIRKGESIKWLEVHGLYLNDSTGGYTAEETQLEKLIAAFRRLKNIEKLRFVDIRINKDSEGAEVDLLLESIIAGRCNDRGSDNRNNHPKLTELEIRLETPRKCNLELFLRSLLLSSSGRRGSGRRGSGMSTCSSIGDFGESRGSTYFESTRGGRKMNNHSSSSNDSKNNGSFTNNNLQSLILWNIHLDTAQGQHLCDALAVNKKIKNLELWRCHLGPCFGLQLCNVLKNNTSIISIVLSHVKLFDYNPTKNKKSFGKDSFANHDSFGNIMKELANTLKHNRYLKSFTIFSSCEENGVSEENDYKNRKVNDIVHTDRDVASICFAEILSLSRNQSKNTQSVSQLSSVTFRYTIHPMSYTECISMDNAIRRNWSYHRISIGKQMKHLRHQTNFNNPFASCKRYCSKQNNQCTEYGIFSKHGKTYCCYSPELEYTLTFDFHD